jgi:hypothetical protein
MQDKTAPETADLAQMHAWLEDVGGSFFIGEGKLDTVKISKNGNKLTLVVKKRKKEDRNSNVATAAER